ncbi:MAG: hypothetical protein R3E32_27780 [Chitinophagales bacterium]
MRNKLIRLLLAVMAFGSLMLQLQAQEADYIPFPKEGAVWHVAGGGHINSAFISYGVVGDTLINDILYAKMYVSPTFDFDISNSEYLTAYRENEQKQVWGIPVGATDERLMYDFSLQSGESTTVYNFVFGEYQYVVVDFIRLETYIGIERKVFELDGYVWYEGIGSEFGPLRNTAFVIDATQIVTCVEENDALVFQSPFAIECDSLPLAIDDVHRADLSVNIYPSILKSNDLLNINLSEYYNHSQTLFITNYTGKVVYQVSFSTQTLSIPISLPKGSYFVYSKSDAFVSKPVRIFIF